MAKPSLQQSAHTVLYMRTAVIINQDVNVTVSLDSAAATATVYLCEVGSPGAVATREPSLYQSMIGSGSPLA